jgi:hypothetical protein
MRAAVSGLLTRGNHGPSDQDQIGHNGGANP